MTHVPQIAVLASVTLAPFLLMQGGQMHRAAMGMWAAYAPRLGLKLLHSVDGRLHSIARKAPPRDAALCDGAPEHWARAFATPVTRRVAENWVMLDRLHRAGIGPEPLGLAVAPRYRSWFTGGATVTAGYYVANLRTYAPKAPTTEAELRAAGVIPDANHAALREQINGYVSDLNAVRGAMPVDAEAEVAALQAALDAVLTGTLTGASTGALAGARRRA